MGEFVKAVLDTAHHRNGVSGAPFGIVLFEGGDSGDERNFIGIVFPEKGHVAVLDVDKLHPGEIDNFGHNCWRGDRFEAELIAALEVNGDSPYPDPEPVEKMYEVQVAIHEYVMVKVTATDPEEAHVKAEKAALLGDIDTTTDAPDIEVIHVEEVK